MFKDVKLLTIFPPRMKMHAVIALRTSASVALQEVEQIILCAKLRPISVQIRAL